MIYETVKINVMTANWIKLCCYIYLFRFWILLKKPKPVRKAVIKSCNLSRNTVLIYWIELYEHE